MVVMYMKKHLTMKTTRSVIDQLPPLYRLVVAEFIRIGAIEIVEQTTKPEWEK
jgi:hypothetical protein